MKKLFIAIVVIVAAGLAYHFASSDQSSHSSDSSQAAVTQSSSSAVDISHLFSQHDGEVKHTASYTVKPGVKKITFTLGANASTGYLWNFVVNNKFSAENSYQEKGVSVSKDYSPTPTGGERVVGSGGKTTVTISLAKSWQSPVDVKMVYARPWNLKNTAPQSVFKDKNQQTLELTLKSGA